METVFWDVKACADKILGECREEVSRLQAFGIEPKLAIVRVGEKGPDLSYEKGALRTMKDAGIGTEVIALDETVTQEEYIDVLEKLSKDPKIHGILTLRPLDLIDENEAIGKHLDPLKDVDACTPGDMGRVLLGDPEALYPCTAAAIVEILEHYKEDVKTAVRAKKPAEKAACGGTDPEKDVLEGLNICIINNSNVIGKPLSLMLTNRFASVSMIHHLTPEEKKRTYTKNADVVIAAVPVKNAVTEEMIEEGTVVIDASVIREKVFDEACQPVINEKTGKQKVRTVGCLTDGAKRKASFLTPVPGVGAVTSACLARNVILACRRLSGLET